MSRQNCNFSEGTEYLCIKFSAIWFSTECTNYVNVIFCANEFNMCQPHHSRWSGGVRWNFWTPTGMDCDVKNFAQLGKFMCQSGLWSIDLFCILCKIRQNSAVPVFIVTLKLNQWLTEMMPLMIGLNANGTCFLTLTNEDVVSSYHWRKNLLFVKILDQVTSKVLLDLLFKEYLTIWYYARTDDHFRIYGRHIKRVCRYCNSVTVITVGW